MNPEAFDIVIGLFERHDLHFAAVARPRVHLADGERPSQRSLNCLAELCRPHLRAVTNASIVAAIRLSCVPSGIQLIVRRQQQAGAMCVVASSNLRGDTCTAPSGDASAHMPAEDAESVIDRDAAMVRPLSFWTAMAPVGHTSAAGPGVAPAMRNRNPAGREMARRPTAGASG